jgi:hypothetical protein
MLGSILSAALLWLTVARSNAIAEKLSMPGGAASLGAVLFGLPAFFFAMLSRRSEHELVSKVLLGPRLASLGCALVLWAAGLILVWRPTASGASATVLTDVFVEVYSRTGGCWSWG